MEDNYSTTLERSIPLTPHNNKWIASAQNVTRLTEPKHIYTGMDTQRTQTLTVIACCPKPDRPSTTERKALDVTDKAAYSTWPSVSELRPGLDTLPQELQDQIHEFTFTADRVCRERSLVTKKEMSILQVDRASRHLAMLNFSAGGIKFDVQEPENPKLLCWIKSFPKAFRPLIDNFECHFAQYTLCRALADSDGYYHFRAQAEAHTICTLLVHGFCAREVRWQGRVAAVYPDDVKAVSKV